MMFMQVHAEGSLVTEMLDGLLSDGLKRETRLWASCERERGESASW